MMRVVRKVQFILLVTSALVFGGACDGMVQSVGGAPEPGSHTPPDAPLGGECPDGQRLVCLGDVDDRVACACQAEVVAKAPTYREAPTGGGHAAGPCAPGEFGTGCPTDPTVPRQPAPGGTAGLGDLQLPAGTAHTPAGAGGDGTVPPVGGSGGAGSPPADPPDEPVSGGVTPVPCQPTASTAFTFLDTLDGKQDGQLFALGNKAPQVACGLIEVPVTGYYDLYDTFLAESCTAQKDETGYLTITNSCNAAGSPLNGNAGDKHVVVDTDNNPACQADSDCGAGHVCRTGNAGTCCVPSDPVFMGRFLLVAGEQNEICLRHWCPEYLQGLDEGKDLGFVGHGCQGANSIHLKIDAQTLLCDAGSAPPASCNK